MQHYQVFPIQKELEIAANYLSIANGNHENVDYSGCICIKPWGHEFMVYKNDRIAIWFLRVVRPNATSLHCHFAKDTLLICLKGTGKIGLIDDETIILNPLSSIFIPRKKFHSLSCFSEDAYYMEIEIFGHGTTFSDKNDLLRINDIYQRPKTGYENSIHILRDPAVLEKYNHFNLDCQNQAINVQDAHVSLSDRIPDARAADTIHVLLEGAVLDENGRIITAGSLLEPNPSYFPLESSVRVLRISSPYCGEDAKVVWNMDHLAHVCDALHRKNRKIVLTSGCFDIIHVGHLEHLKRAKLLAPDAVLMVCLSSDKQISELKGKTRPINNYNDRINLLKGVSYVDYIVLYDEANNDTEETLDHIMRLVNPFVWTKGSDYTEKQIYAKHPCLARVCILPNVDNKSTTNIVTRCSAPSI